MEIEVSREWPNALFSSFSLDMNSLLLDWGCPLRIETVFSPWFSETVEEFWAKMAWALDGVGSYETLSAPGWSSWRFAAVHELLTPLALARLEDYPVLEKSRVTVEGDYRQQQRPAACTVRLSSLVRRLQLSRTRMDGRGVVGYALTAPSKHQWPWSGCIFILILICQHIFRTMRNIH